MASFAGAIAVIGVLAGMPGLTSDVGHSRDVVPAALRWAPSQPSPAAARSLRVPESVGDYRRVTGADANRVVDHVRASLQAQNPKGTAYRAAKIAIYLKRSGDQPMVFVGLPGKEIPELAAELRSRTPSQEADAAFSGLRALSKKDYPAGPLGGVLRCGLGPTNDGGKKPKTAAVCVWADRSVLALVTTPLNTDVPGLAKTTLALRNAAEY